MIDATEFFMTYRECARHLWNTYYRTPDEGESDFLYLERSLFHDLFLARATNKEYKATPDGFYDEVVVSFDVPPNGRSILILNPEIRPGFDTWENEEIKIQSLDLRYVELFDFWNPPDGLRDFRYVRARVVGSPARLELVGKDVLIDATDVRIFVRD